MKPARPVSASTASAAIGSAERAGDLTSDDATDAPTLDAFVIKTRDRWDRPPEAPRHAWRTGSLVVASIVAHGVVLSLILVRARSAAVPLEKEIAVEVVQEQAPAAHPPPSAPSPSASKPPDPPLRRKQEEAVKPPVEPPPSHEVKSAAQSSRKSESPSKPDDPSKELQALKDELAQLDAEKAALRRQRDAATVLSEHRAERESTFRPEVLSGTASDGAEAASYEMLVFSSIEKAKGLDSYKGRPGAVNVRFVVDDKGRIASVDVQTSSGNPVLDTQALALVRRAAPFPAPPPGAQRSFVAGITFGRPNSLLP